MAPRKTLATGRKPRQSVADKLDAKTPSVVPTATPIAITPTVSKEMASTVPGLPVFTPESVSAMMPKFEETAYAVVDPLNPPATLPQVSEAHYNRSMSIYKGATYALQLSGAGFDLSREKFNVISKRAKAYGAGLQAATAFEKVRGDFYDYQNQLETNTQKSVTLDVNRHRTGVVSAQAPFDKTSLDEKLRQSSIAAQLATAQTQSKQSALDEFVNQLGEVKAA